MKKYNNSIPDYNMMPDEVSWAYMMNHVKVLDSAMYNRLMETQKKYPEWFPWETYYDQLSDWTKVQHRNAFMNAGLHRNEYPDYIIEQMNVFNTLQEPYDFIIQMDKVNRMKQVWEDDQRDKRKKLWDDHFGVYGLPFWE